MSEGARVIAMVACRASAKCPTAARAVKAAPQGGRILARISPYRQSRALARNCAARGEVAGRPARITGPTVVPPKRGAPIPRRTSKTPPSVKASPGPASPGPAVPPDKPAVRPGGQAGTGTPLIATLTTTTGQGAFRRQARATGPMPSGAQPALPSTSISAPSA